MLLYINKKDYEYGCELYFNTRFVTELAINNLEMSCGAKEISNFDELSYVLYERRCDAEIKSKFDAQIIKDLKNIFSFIKKEENVAFLICSNTTTTHKHRLLAKYFDALCNGKSTVKVNPNSKNRIKVWIL